MCRSNRKLDSEFENSIQRVYSEQEIGQNYFSLLPCFLFMAHFISIFFVSFLTTQYETIIDDSIQTKIIQTFFYNIVPILTFFLLLLKFKKKELKEKWISPSCYKYASKRKIIISAIIVFAILYLSLLCIALNNEAKDGIYYWFYFLIGVALTEEFMYRLVISDMLMCKVSPKKAGLISSILFSLMHLALPLGIMLSTHEMIIIKQFFGPFLAGLLLFSIKKRTGSLGICILLHAMVDFYLEVLR